MSTIGWIILAIIVVVVVVALVALALALRKRRRQQRAARASELRSEAMAKGGDVTVGRRQASTLDANAQMARAEAERAEEKAAEARRAVQQQEAEREDRLREADRLDPSVDHTADTYEPPTRGNGAGPTGETGEFGAHRRE